LRILRAAIKTETDRRVAKVKPFEGNPSVAKSDVAERVAKQGLPVESTTPPIKAVEQEAPVANEASRERDSAGASREDHSITIKAIRNAHKTGTVKPYAGNVPAVKSDSAERVAKQGLTAEFTTPPIKAAEQEAPVANEASRERDSAGETPDAKPSPITTAVSLV